MKVFGFDPTARIRRYAVAQLFGTEAKEAYDRFVALDDDSKRVLKSHFSVVEGKIDPRSEEYDFLLEGVFTALELAGKRPEVDVVYEVVSRYIPRFLKDLRKFSALF